MPISLKVMAGVAALLGALPAASDRLAAPGDAGDVAIVGPGTFAYRQAGEFLRDGNPVNAPIVTLAFEQPIAIMKRQVSRAEYDRCTAAGACRPLTSAAGGDAATMPAVGVNWHDATSYAAWISHETGQRWRLPSDAEWAYVAGDRFIDDALPDGGSDPAQRWIAAYERESAAETVDAAPMALGTFGTNANGVDDLAGNVWEWTTTCFTRTAETSDGRYTTIESCGVRVVEGRHRAYMSDFVRDPRGGACSAGQPPANLGFRLIREAG
jgi:formylglycine-generating enzyme required for sulfatase activity